MEYCLYCGGKLEIITKGFCIGQLKCTVCRATFDYRKTKIEDYECDEHGNPKK